MERICEFIKFICIWTLFTYGECLENSQRSLEADGSNRVAFSAYLSNSVTTLRAAQIIPFDQVNFNDGQGFDTASHAFTCPVDGIYVFQAALMSTLKSHIEIEVLVDNAPLFAVYSSGIRAGSYDQGFNVGITRCEKGHKVWMRANQGSSVKHYQFTTFSGYLLWKTEARTGSHTGSEQKHVAFHTYVSWTVYNLGIGSAVPFDQIFSNEGQAFNTKTHQFTCPVTGVYRFQSAVFSNNGMVETEIVQNGFPFARMYADGDGSSSQQHDQGFNSGIVHCDKGQRVWVRIRQGSSVMHYQFTTFSGHLIWEIKSTTTATGKRQAYIENNHLAFHAYLSYYMTSPMEDGLIPFDKVLLNEGQSFDAATHTFTCPVRGVYLFQCALMGESSNIEIEVVKNGSSFVRLFIASQYDHDQSFNAGIIQWDVGQTVWVRSNGHLWTKIRPLHSTSFSGFLLWEV